MNSVFSSKAATTNIANRAAREAERKMLDPATAVRDALIPIGRAIGRRGKLMRQELRPAFRQLIDRLSSLDSVVEIEPGVISTSATQRLSANEAVQVRFIQTSGAQIRRYGADIWEDILTFLAFEIVLSRHEIRLFANSAGFTLHPHALSRYMQREGKSHKELIAKSLRPMRASAMLGQVVVQGNIALPVDGGLLFGDVQTEEKSENFPLLTILDRNGGTDEPVDEWSDEFTRCMMLTFINTESLEPAQARLLERLVAWERQHHEGIHCWYQMCVYNGSMLRAGEVPSEINDDMQRAWDAAIELVESPEWQSVVDD